MKNIFWTMLVVLLMLTTSAMGQNTHKERQNDIKRLSEKIDSLEKIVDILSNEQQKSIDLQLAITNRLNEIREDYTNLLCDSHETRNWVLGIVTLIVGAFGVAFPFFQIVAQKGNPTKQKKELLNFIKILKI